MEDRFKFRAWDTDRLEMFYTSESETYNIATGWESVSEHRLRYGRVEKIMVCSDGLYYWDEPDLWSYGGGEWSEAFNNVILMQCTGLKDKNGKLIYEGDILNIDCYKLETYIVEWCDYRAGWVIVHTRKLVAPEAVPDCEDLDGTIIGNIHENPDLLTGL